MTSDKRKICIAVLDDYQGLALSCADWSALGANAEVNVFRDHLHEPERVVERLMPFDAVCLMRERTSLSADMLARLPNLKLIVTAAMWNASVDLDVALDRGIVVSGTASVPSGTPELTWMLILALARHLPAELASMRNGGWQSTLGVDLEGRTLGILGLGIIGTRLAKVANAFGMNVIAWSHNLTAERARDAGARRVECDELLRESDFISVSLKLSDRTRGLIGEREFGLMKPSAYFINTSRGPIVSEAALIDALRRKRIAGAGIDVFDIEPIAPDHPLRTMDNVIATPHIGYVTESTYAHFFPQMVEDIRAWMEGAPIRLLQPRA